MKNRNLIITIEMITLVLAITILESGIFMTDQRLKRYVADAIILCILVIAHICMPKFAGLEPGHPKVKTMRRYNILMGAIVLFLRVKQYLLPADGTENNRWLLVFSVAVMLLVGNAAPKLPRNGVIGIRLPWTMRDEDTWRMAHRKLGYCAFPIALITLAGGLLIDSEIFAIGGLLAFALVPTGWSWLYDYRKRKG